MITILDWITDNVEKVIAMGVLVIILSMTGTITTSIRTAKKGLKEAVTPLGFVVLLAIAYIAYQIYLSIMNTI